MEELCCNNSKCASKLNTSAWVTSCFHIFCNDCVVKEFNETSVCPLCKTKFVDKLDVKFVDLQPSERAKTMMMVGLKPEIIVEICQRSLSFWSYQTAHHINSLESYANSVKEQKIQLEQLYKHLISRAETTVTGLKQQNEGLKKDLELLRQRNAEFSDKMMEKNRYIHKLQNMYEASRRRVISSRMSEDKEVGFIHKFCNNTDGHQNKGHLKGPEEPIRPWKMSDDLAINMSFCCLNENAPGPRNEECSNPKLF